ncbi:DNA gyrase inhibitor YacG [Rhodoblastus sp.]|uniref:DNA gyrase inhibitor YacG n=1 Tax=Rhodoblastus sp. TaxID=1962975 RepID=UPI002617CB72|nr:DNA gyrase inhibitor YacG [Rhodoblastus sp.]
MARATKPAQTRTAPCPICGKAVEAAFKPFCSKRCADVDLNRWLNGAYVIAGEAVDETPPANGVMRDLHED